MMHSLLALLVTVTTLQTTLPLPSHQPSPLDKRFDFWLGKWNATWTNPDGSLGKGINTITRILNGKIIKENFEVKEDPKTKGFIGLSFSAYSPSTKAWKQTWVDNQGSYLDFYGKFEGDKRIFQREFIAATGKFKGKKIMQRMVFYNIQHESFDWDWEVSPDEGKTWTLRWRIKYTRVKDTK